MSRIVSMSTQQLSPLTGVIPTLGFGDRLRRVRLDFGLTQKEFAAAIGMKGAAYGHHELKWEYPANARLIALAIHSVYGVDVGWLMAECPGPELNWGPTPYKAVSSNVVTFPSFALPALAA